MVLIDRITGLEIMMDFVKDGEGEDFMTYNLCKTVLWRIKYEVAVQGGEEFLKLHALYDTI